MKKNILLTIIIMIVLAGCANDISLLDPIVGTWQNDDITKTVLVFNNDDTVMETVTVIGSLGVTRSGTWSSTSTTITRVWSDDSTDTNTYYLNSNNSVLTLSKDGLSVTFIKL